MADQRKKCKVKIMSDHEGHDYVLPQKEMSPVRGFSPAGRYGAKVYRGGRIIAKNGSKHFTKEQIDAWIAENWPGDDLKYHKVESWETPLELKVWRYDFPGMRIVIHARFGTIW